MDDLIDLLRERHQGSLVALELPDEDRLVEIEEQLLIPLPGEYKEFLLTTGDILCGSLEPATVTDEYAHNFLPELAAQAWDQGMPRSLIPVCQAADGLYAIAQDGQIVFWVPGRGMELYLAVGQRGLAGKLKTKPL